MKRNVSLKTYFGTVVALLIILLASVTFVRSAGEIGIKSHSFIKTASYVIEKDGSTIKAYNGTTGALAYSGTNASTVIQNTLNALTSGRTYKERVVFKGIFEFSGFEYADCVTIPNNTILDFAGSFVTIADGFEYEDDHYIFGTTSACENIEIRNLKFDENYDGSPDGFGYILQFAEPYGLVISGCDLRSAERGYGVKCGTAENRGARVRFIDNTVENVGPDFYGVETICSHNTIINDTVDLLGDNSIVTCNIGWSSETRFSVTGDNNTFTNNILKRTGAGTLVSFSGSDSVISNNVFGGSEPTADVVGLELGGEDVSYNLVSQNVFTYLENGVLTDGCSTSVYHNKITNNILRDCNYGIKLDAGANHNVQHNDLFNCTTGIYIADSNCTIQSNIFEDVTTPIQNLGSDNTIKFNEGYVTENSGTSEASNDDYIAHGLVAEPTLVDLTIEETDANYFLQLEATNATHFQIYLQFANETACEVDKTINWITEYHP